MVDRFPWKLLLSRMFGLFIFSLEGTFQLLFLPPSCSSWWLCQFDQLDFILPFLDSLSFSHPYPPSSHFLFPFSSSPLFSDITIAIKAKLLQPLSLAFDWLEHQENPLMSRNNKKVDAVVMTKERRRWFIVTSRVFCVRYIYIYIYILFYFYNIFSPYTQLFFSRKPKNKVRKNWDEPNRYQQMRFLFLNPFFFR